MMYSTILGNYGRSVYVWSYIYKPPSTSVSKGFNILFLIQEAAEDMVKHLQMVRGITEKDYTDLMAVTDEAVKR